MHVVVRAHFAVRSLFHFFVYQLVIIFIESLDSAFIFIVNLTIRCHGIAYIKQLRIKCGNRNKSINANVRNALHYLSKSSGLERDTKTEKWRKKTYTQIARSTQKTRHEWDKCEEIVFNATHDNILLSFHFARFVWNWNGANAMQCSAIHLHVRRVTFNNRKDDVKIINEQCSLGTWEVRAQ